MRTFSLSLLFSLLFVCGASGGDNGICYLWVDSVNMRDSPGLDGKVTAVLKEGASLTYLNEKSSFSTKLTLRGRDFDQPWGRFRTADGKTGWVYLGAVMTADYLIKAGAGSAEILSFFKSMKNGRKAVFQPGTYRVSYGADGWLAGKNDIAIEGAGDVRIIFENRDCGVWGMSGCTNVTVRNIRFSHFKKADKDGCTIMMVGDCGSVVFENCFFNGGREGICAIGDAGLSLVHCELCGNWNWALYTSLVKKLELVSNTITNNGSPVMFSDWVLYGGTNAEGLVMQGNVLDINGAKYKQIMKEQLDGGE